MKKKSFSSNFKLLCFLLSALSVTTSYGQVNRNENYSTSHYLARRDHKISLHIEQKDPDVLKFRAIVDNPDQSRILIEVLNGLNEVVSRQESDKTAFAVNYDFGNAPDGEYIIRVKSGKEKVTEKIRIETVIREEKVATVNRKHSRAF